jgi:hypothetical protein
MLLLYNFKHNYIKIIVLSLPNGCPFHFLCIILTHCLIPKGQAQGIAPTKNFSPRRTLSSRRKLNCVKDIQVHESLPPRRLTLLPHN